MSKPASGLPSAAATPVPSSPPPSESYLSELDGTASVLETSYGDVSWEPPADPTALNLVSWKLDVDARVEDGVEKRGFNAISTVLNHPTKKANPLRGTRKPLPPLSQPPPLLPKPVPPSHYDPYLKAITPAYEAFVAAQAAATSSAELEPRAPDPAPDLPPLDTIPAAFFSPDFDIANPSTWADVVGAADDDAAASAGVQDGLSTYLDTLERHLAHEITLRSGAFFSALSNLQDLHAESASCLARIGRLRGELAGVGSGQARKGLDVIEAQERLRTLRATEAGVKRVAELDELVRVARGLADGGVWEGALGCVEDVVRWWARHDVDAAPADDGGHAELPLATLPALADLPATVADLTRSIAAQLEGVLSSLLSGIFSSNADHADHADEPDVEPFRAAARPVLAGLVRCGRREVVDAVWKEVVADAIRQGSRRHLPVSQGDDEPDTEGRQQEARGQHLAQALQSMDHAQFLLLSTQMFGSLLHRIHLAKTYGDVLASILEEVQSLPALSIASHAQSVSMTPKLAEPAAFDPADVVSQACELANTRASKILAVRSEQHAALSLEDFVEVFRESWQFVVTTETLARRMIVSLRGVAASQARAYLISYHAQRLTKSAKLVEEETWVQVDVPRATQHVVDLVVDAAVGDPAECFIPPRAAANGNGNGNGDAAAAPGKQVLIEDKPFFVVKATGETLALLGDYLKIVINLEIVVTDVMSRIIEFLKSFNSRTCQVVLGAGAMRSAGLKNITAKHLALASQSLSAVVSLIPYIREFIRRHLNPKQAVMLIEFDKLRRDYQEHQNEIHAKLVAIMADRLAVHCASLREIDWEATPDKDGPRPYAEMLVKETATLHKVLSKYLAQQTVEVVMSQVLAAIVHRLSEEYSRVEFKSEDAKKRMMQDVSLVAARLQPLSEAAAPAAALEVLVRDKPTPRRPVGQAVRGLLRRSGSANVAAVSVADEVGEGGAGAEGAASDDDGEDGPAAAAADPAGPATPSKRAAGGAVDDDVAPELADTPAPTSPGTAAPPETPSKSVPGEAGSLGPPTAASAPPATSEPDDGAGGEAGAAVEPDEAGSAANVSGEAAAGEQDAADMADAADTADAGETADAADGPGVPEKDEARMNGAAGGDESGEAGGRAAEVAAEAKAEGTDEGADEAAPPLPGKD